MSSGTCPNCGKENLKNIEVHMRYCKKKVMKQEPPISKSPQPQTPAEPITSSNHLIKEIAEKSRMKNVEISIEKPQISLEMRENNSIDRNIYNIKNLLYLNLFLNSMTIITLAGIISFN